MLFKHNYGKKKTVILVNVTDGTGVQAAKIHFIVTYSQILIPSCKSGQKLACGNG